MSTKKEGSTSSDKLPNTHPSKSPGKRVSRGNAPKNVLTGSNKSSKANAQTAEWKIAALNLQTAKTSLAGGMAMLISGAMNLLPSSGDTGVSQVTNIGQVNVIVNNYYIDQVAPPSPSVGEVATGSEEGTKGSTSTGQWVFIPAAQLKDLSKGDKGILK